jgi:hypothetical protein
VVVGVETLLRRGNFNRKREVSGVGVARAKSSGFRGRSFGGIDQIGQKRRHGQVSRMNDGEWCRVGTAGKRSVSMGLVSCL